MALSANALTTVAQLELALESGATTAVLEFYINAASEMIERVCGRKFGREDVTERVKGYGTELIHLDRTPVEAIASITCDGVAVPDVDYRLRDAEIGSVWRRDGWPDTANIELSASPHPRAGFEEDSIVVVYTGGYTLAGEGRPPPGFNQPFDLELACIELATVLYRSKGRNLALTGKQVGNASEQYAGGVAGMPAIPTSIADKLAPYLRVR